MKTFIEILSEITTTTNIPNIPTKMYKFTKCKMENGKQGWNINNGHCYLLKDEAIANEKN